MSFINPMGEMLLIYTIATLSGAIYLFIVFLKGEEIREKLDENMGVAYIVLGFLAILYALFMNFTWPIKDVVVNGTVVAPLHIYNQQFGEPYLWFGVITFVVGYSLMKGIDLKPVSYIAFFASLFMFRYAYNFLEFQLTREPLFAFLIYFFIALAAFISPLWTHLDERNRRYLTLVMAILIFLSGAISGITAFEAVRGHIAEGLAST